VLQVSKYLQNKHIYLRLSRCGNCLGEAGLDTLKNLSMKRAGLRPALYYEQAAKLHLTAPFDIIPSYVENTGLIEVSRVCRH
jgi:hypothetical protein